MALQAVLGREDLATFVQGACELFVLTWRRLTDHSLQEFLHIRLLLLGKVVTVGAWIPLSALGFGLRALVAWSCLGLLLFLADWYLLLFLLLLFFVLFKLFLLP